MIRAVDRIIDALEANPAGLCDDCLADVAQVASRVHVNMLCRPLANAGSTDRDKSACPRCGTWKFVNRLRQQATLQVGELAGPVYKTEPVPTTADEDAGAWLDGIRRQMLRILEAVEGDRPENDGVAKKINRMEEQEALPGTICCMMRTLNALRNLVVYEHVHLGRHELSAATSAWACVQDWWKERQVAR